MTMKQKADRARVIVGIVSAVLGVAGLIFETWWLTGAALGFALLWLVLCMACIRLYLNEGTRRHARKGNR